jgi:hypothetical protein
MCPTILTLSEVQNDSCVEHKDAADGCQQWYSDVVFATRLANSAKLPFKFSAKR